ncbi:PREDICTED: killer cell lectin-like receptor subfamily B member 1B allele C [Thamnophis sirtalis]|uniref:Killer cell lectin-like receptor subfamily B member 1B allele C n=1 Tax=Thamnophis sirtalis TaxID=35019 RepID=A0A6I9XHT7_9SAUR|nr:PREDICTED: killer cell lectin-like receptor subfamily B member 1B allele C [Thamnophis sirtalis]
MDTGLVYADIICSEDSSSRRSSNCIAVQQADHRICPPWRWTVLWLSCTGNVLLMAAVIVMGVYGLRCISSVGSQNSQEMTGISNAHQCKQDENKTNKELEKLRTFLRQHLCEATNASTENGSCSVCPVTWLPYEDKCYWFSTSAQTWDQSNEECLAKRSQLLVISSIGEQEFIKNNTKTESPTWIGLKLKLPEKKWMWVNGSPLNHTPSRHSIAVCGTIGKKGIASDICSVDLNWICQKPSIFI